MGRIYITFQYLRHRIKARKWDSFHSPYLFRLFTYCLNKKNQSFHWDEIEQQRKKLLQTNETILRTDFGAGSVHFRPEHPLKVSAIARHSLSLPFQCRFLYRLVQFTKPDIVVEFGTSLGISSAYLSLGAPEARIITIEGDPALALHASKVFDSLCLKNIELHFSTFEAYVTSQANDASVIQFFFLDGNHRSGALLNYYQSLKHRFNQETIIVVDDIYWSPDMHQGWKQLQDLPEVTQSVDCFHFGLLFFRPGFLNKENHLVRLPFWTL